MSTFDVAAYEATPVFEAYWRFAAERQNVLYRRLEGWHGPWTTDPILARYRFTNAFRASDRVSQYLIRNVQYAADLDPAPEEVLFRTLLFKIFNRIETWETLVGILGTPTLRFFEPEAYDRALSAEMARKNRVYSAAYIMPPVQTFGPGGAKHTGHLRLLDSMLSNGITHAVQATTSLQELFALLKSFPSFGPFLAFQLAIDINYSRLTAHRESEFVVAGPGAIDGISRCFGLEATARAQDIIMWVFENQDREFEKRGIEFHRLEGRRLQPIDCQNLFCEISKYARVAFPQIQSISGRTRIKQSYSIKGPLPPLFLPPKWRDEN
ncbi:nucleotide kinase domain-containing protein [Devosia sediminis]|uniref:5-hmdU DNA kinase helical domain-containing protein n=1 Tax=Devosia sediminis TaxID=2798801 RepID=A0A934MLY2_9HYPH|nr:nucleotide kinase domain-containing protein [Devosia sediminis]MBJ3785625.1 hypothetical protein [Devosia sediminis]